MKDNLLTTLQEKLDWLNATRGATGANVKLDAAQLGWIIDALQAKSVLSRDNGVCRK